MGTPGRTPLALVARWLGVVLLVALALPGPAGAQSPPSIALAPDHARAATSGTWTIQVSGSGFYANRSDGRISFDGDATSFPFTTNGNGFFNVTIAPGRRGPGPKQVVAVQPNVCAPRAVCGASASATFWAMDGTVTDESTGRTDCGPAGAPFSVRVEGRGWDPNRAGYVTFARNGVAVDRRIRIPVNKDGTWSTAGWGLPAQPASGTYEFVLDDANKREVRLPWTIPCPVGPTTTIAPTTTTIRPDVSTTSTTAPVAAAELFVEPALGPPGFVTSVRGVGYPPGPVTVRWTGGVGQVTATAAADGTFSVPLLVLPNDRLGQRSVVAEAGPVSLERPFLVVPGTVQPSGRDVAQITRARRHLQR